MITSIRSRLLITLLITIVSVSSVTITLSYYDAQHEVQELFDAQLAQSARVLQALLIPELLQDKQEQLQALLDDASVAEYEEDSLYGHAYELKIAFQMWNKAGKRLLTSVSAPKHSLHTGEFSNSIRGYIDVDIDNNKWRVFNLWDEQGIYLIQTAERYDVRNELVADISNRLIMPALFSIPILGLVIWLGIGRGLLPLQAVASEVTQRNPANLHAMEFSQVPKEIVPLVTELNKLFIQVQQVLEKERRFTDDAAHELRTPLASLKTQAQVALRATDDEEKHVALIQLITGVDRAAHLIEQMLILARLNPEVDKQQIQHIELHMLSADIIALQAPKAFKKGINIELTGTEHAVVKGDEISYTILINNLIDNAIRYTPPQGEVTVAIRTEPDAVKLTVEDTGPGIAEELIGRVFDRFFRVLGTETTGCGLGLAIVKQISERYGIGVKLENRLDPNGQTAGLRAVLTFAAGGPD